MQTAKFSINLVVTTAKFSINLVVLYPFITVKTQKMPPRKLSVAFDFI